MDGRRAEGHLVGGNSTEQSELKESSPQQLSIRHVESEAVGLWALRVARLLALGSNDFPPTRGVRRFCLRKLLRAVGLSIGSGVRLDRFHPELGGSLRLGRDVEIGAGTAIDVSGGLWIGDGVTLSEGVRILTHDHVVIRKRKHWREQGLKKLPVTVGDGTWIGAGAIVLGACSEVGEGAIVGAGAVVTKAVEVGTIVVGNPAKLIARRK